MRHTMRCCVGVHERVGWRSEAFCAYRRVHNKEANGCAYSANGVPRRPSKYADVCTAQCSKVATYEVDAVSVTAAVGQVMTEVRPTQRHALAVRYTPQRHNDTNGTNDQHDAGHTAVSDWLPWCGML